MIFSGYDKLIRLRNLGLGQYIHCHARRIMWSLSRPVMCLGALAYPMPCTFYPSLCLKWVSSRGGCQKVLHIAHNTPGLRLRSGPPLIVRHSTFVPHFVPALCSRTLKFANSAGLEVLQCSRTLIPHFDPAL